MAQYLAIVAPVAVVVFGWIISVERRITTLQAMATDIHDIKTLLKTFVGQVE